MVQKTLTPLLITSAPALILLCVYSVSIALQSHVYLPMFFPLLFGIWLSRYALKPILKKLFFLNTLIAIIVITLLLQHEYTMALLMLVRSNLILLFGLLLFHDKDEFSIAIGMQQLGLPSKLTSMLFFTAKSIFLLKREFEYFRKTLYVRGFIAKTNLLSYKTLAGFIGILVIKAIARASYLQKAMLLRRFSGNVNTLAHRIPFSRWDVFLFIFTCLSLLWRQGVVI